MSYIEGFVTPVPTAGKAAFTDHARRAAVLMRELGVQRIVDGWGDDVPRGKLNDFAGAVQLRDDETVSFGWMEFPDKPARDAFMARMMADPRMAELGDMPFDGRRMIFGGFRTIVDRGAAAGTGYVDGIILPVPDGNEAGYVAMAEEAAAVFRDHGVTRYLEAWGDDVPAGEVTDFVRATHVRDGETPVFAWCEWPDKATRDAGWARVMQDPRMKKRDELPFDAGRMVYGGFAIVSDAPG